IGEDNKAISQFNRCKSLGLDVLPTKFYQLGITDISEMLTDLYNQGMKQGMLHENFYQCFMILLYKINDEYELSNWGHLTMMSLDYKIFAKVVMNRLNDVLEKNNHVQ
uniref:Uncharacterized protein n=1 Tax=Esox lucius TaxID=8010 RepID=A0A6Q2YE28_ESOLU